MNKGLAPPNLDLNKNLENHQEKIIVTSSLLSMFDALFVLLPLLIGVAYVTVAERKTLASMQRRLVLI